MTRAPAPSGGAGAVPPPPRREAASAAAWLWAAVATSADIRWNDVARPAPAPTADPAAPSYDVAKPCPPESVPAIAADDASAARRLSRVCSTH